MTKRKFEWKINSHRDMFVSCCQQLHFWGALIEYITKKGRHDEEKEEEKSENFLCSLVVSLTLWQEGAHLKKVREKSYSGSWNAWFFFIVEGNGKLCERISLIFPLSHNIQINRKAFALLSDISHWCAE